MIIFFLRAYQITQIKSYDIQRSLSKELGRRGVFMKIFLVVLMNRSRQYPKISIEITKNQGINILSYRAKSPDDIQKKLNADRKSVV